MNPFVRLVRTELQCISFGHLSSFPQPPIISSAGKGKARLRCPPSVAPPSAVGRGQAESAPQGVVLRALLPVLNLAVSRRKRNSSECRRRILKFDYKHSTIFAEPRAMPARLSARPEGKPSFPIRRENAKSAARAPARDHHAAFITQRRQRNRKERKDVVGSVLGRALARVHGSRCRGGPPPAACGQGMAPAHASMATAILLPLRCCASPPHPADTETGFARH